VSLKAVFAGVPIMDCRMKVVMSGCVDTGSVIRCMVFTRKETSCRHPVIQFQGYKEDEGGEGQVCVAYRDTINTFDKRQRHSHDPGQLLIGASDRNVSAGVDNRVLWSELGVNVVVFLLKFRSFVNDVVPGLTAELFRIVTAFCPAHVMQVSRQGSKWFGLARSAKKECVRLGLPNIHSKEPRWKVLAAE